jgi:hypothetical protein
MERGPSRQGTGSHDSILGRLVLSIYAALAWLTWRLDIAIAIYKPADVRPILEAYRGKNIPLEYAKKEAEAKLKHIEEWQNGKKGIGGGGFTLSRLFGGGSDHGTVSNDYCW